MNLRVYLFIVLVFFHAQASFSKEVFHYGVVPWTHSKLLQAWASPIKKRLEAQLKQSVQITSSANIGAYLQKAMDNKMQVFQVPAHLAVYLIDEYAFKPVVYVEGRSHVVLLSLSDSGVSDLKEASKAEVIVGSPLMMTTQIGKKWFVDAGLTPTYVYQKDQWQVMDALFSEGNTKVAIVMSAMYENLAPVLKNKLVEIKRSNFPVSGMLLATPQLDEETVKRIQNSFLSFDANTHYFLVSASLPTALKMKKMREMVAPYYVETMKEIKQTLKHQ